MLSRGGVIDAKPEDWAIADNQSAGYATGKLKNFGCPAVK
jgi:hypothetical protein